MLSSRGSSPTQGSKPGSLKSPALAGRLFTTWEAHFYVVPITSITSIEMLGNTAECWYRVRWREQKAGAVGGVLGGGPLGEHAGCLQVYSGVHLVRFSLDALFLGCILGIFIYKRMPLPIKACPSVCLPHPSCWLCLDGISDSACVNFSWGFPEKLLDLA